MAAMRHPNVVGFLGVCATPPCVATGAALGTGRAVGWRQGRSVAGKHAALAALGACPAPPPTGPPRPSALPPPCAEYCGRGSLTDVLRGGKNSPAKAKLLDWARRLNMALDAAKGMHCEPAVGAHILCVAF